LPARVPRRPRVRIGPESGTATRLVSTPITETSSKLVAMIGVVAIWAARETAKRFESRSGGLWNGRRTVCFTSAWRGFLRRRMPKTAATESWKPGL
jgi:hypothetical protein